MSNKPATVTLDKPRTLRFDAESFIRLDEECGIDAYRLDLRAMTPKQTRDLVWAGQLHTPKPLTREQVTKHLPTEAKAVIELRVTAYGELLKAMGFKGDEETEAEASADPS